MYVERGCLVFVLALAPHRSSGPWVLTPVKYFRISLQLNRFLHSVHISYLEWLGNDLVGGATFSAEKKIWTILLVNSCVSNTYM